MTDQDFRLHHTHAQRGIALISALLLLLLMSALAVAVLIKVNTDQRLQKTDSGNNLAYYGAEAGMEKLTADLGSLYARNAAPNWCDITNLQNGFPAQSDVGVTYAQYAITIPVLPVGCAAPPWRVQTISQGPNAGLIAQIVPLTLQVTADRPGGEEVSMVRQVEVALIPVFQFGVFSQSDLSFFPGPDFDFNGRTQTNGNLFLASQSSLTFHTFIRAAGDVVRDQLANGAGTVAQGRTSPVNIPTTTAGCDGAKPACRNLTVAPTNEGSSIGGPTPTYGGTGVANTTGIGWTSISKSTYNSIILSGSTGVKPLSLSFVQSGVNPIEILRRPAAGEPATSALGESRLYNQAQIRVLLSDDPAELPGGAGDANNIRLANVRTNAATPDYSKGVPAAVPAGMPAMPSGSGKPYMTWFAEASTATQNPTTWNNTTAQRCLPSDWTTVPSTPAPASAAFTLLNYETAPVNVASPTAAVFTAPTTGYAPFVGTGNPTAPPAGFCFATAAQAAALVPVAPAPSVSPAPPTTWNLIDGYLRVEIRQADGTYLPVTQEWVELGFARGLKPPTAAAPNPVHPNAILLFQEPADRDGNGVLDPVGAPQKCSAGPPAACGITKPPEVQTDPDSNRYYYGDGKDSTSVTRNNWYPINFYDAREGELRENQRASTTCFVSGVMNVVEIDVKNLQRWLNGTTGTNGKSTEAVTQNGYVLYFSDRRGMLANPNAGNVKNGEYGFEDVINPKVALGTPNATLDTGEDADGNGKLDTWGATDLGLGFGAGNTGNPNTAVNCMNMARKNWISGARHAVRLVDGSQGNVPVRWDSAPVGGGGFTLATENPAYILGDYNANAANCTGAGCTNLGTWIFTGAHASSAVIADTVTLLSNNWTDLESFTSPTDVAGRTGATTYFRVAIASGKNINFPLPTWGGAPAVPADFGTDGGVHNFLRYLENWGGTNSNYMGSMVSLYYSQYATGIFKCCNTVYSPPRRQYAFDLDFLDVTKLPPGTPKFRDVVDVGFQQVF